MRIAILGTGKVARSIGGGLARAGHEVDFGSRSGAADPDLPGRVASLADAAAVGELVINATPGATSLEMLKQIGAGPLAGKVLMDVSNAIRPGFDLMYHNSSLGALIQSTFPDSAVVKALNTVHAGVMADSQALSAPTIVFLSGDDGAAKATVSELLADIGWSPESQIDLGDITTARATEHFILLSAALSGAIGSTSYNLSITQ
ncbi:NADPH-dependent F420 reductase [Actinopolymorpha pittospori]|uniref:Dinucleotide-binding enzyme n=1 Tax=Actinopolymorpha pittospori TaxID=648752 RepID=A0A927MVG2_9ACTN|nr:NAD(P)-binding domain-containing protein [Actinopolymorpha pittospori]MBE1606974.1 putative dinucleotide-binding enzyme [Actinopolymorpha pittospori]